MRCVAYCRVSTDEKEQLSSFNNQRQFYLDLFSNREDLIPAPCGMLYKRKGNKEERIYNEEGVFADEGISGTKLKNREAFKYMMECAKRKEFDAIYVKNVSRWSRNIIDGMEVIKRLKGWNIRVIFEDGPFDSLGEGSEQIINIYMSMAQNESESKSRAIKFGLIRLRKNGGWCSSVVYGYNRVNGYLEINEEEANIVKKIFSLYLEEGYGANKIARYLMENNIPTKKKASWTLAQIRGMLRNKLYIGIQTTNKSTNTDINMVSDKTIGTKYIKQNDPDEWIITERPELKIIEKDYFERVQIEIEKRQETHTINKSYASNHILSNLIVCGHCNGAYRRKQRGRGKAKEELGYCWTCGKHDTYGNDACAFRYAFIESDFIEFIKQKILDLKQADLTSEFEAYLGIYYNFDPVEMEQLREKLKKIDNRIKNSINLHSDGEITKEDFQSIYKELQEQKNKVSTEYNRMVNHEKEIKEARRNYKEYLKSLEEIDVDNITNNDLKKIFRIIIIKPYGKGLIKGEADLLMAEFNYNLLGININKLIDDIKQKGGVLENDLLNKLRYCNFEAIVMKKGEI